MDIYKNNEEYIPNENHKTFIVFDDVNDDILTDKKLNLVFTELFMRGRKLNIFIVSSRKSYFAAPKDIRLNFTHYFIMDIPSKQQIQQIAFNHSSDIDFKDFLNLYKKYTAKSYSFLDDATLASDSPSRLRLHVSFIF